MTSRNGEDAKDDKLSEHAPLIPRPPFDILNQYGRQVKRFRQGKLIKASSDGTPSGGYNCQRLSSTEMRLVRLPSQETEGCNNSSAYAFEFLSSISRENLKDMELISSLLNGVENLCNQKFDCADRCLSMCIPPRSDLSDSPLQKVVKHFAEALRERVDIERGRIDLERNIFLLEESLLDHQPAVLVLEQKLPAAQISQFTAIQTILECVGTAKRIHLVDFGIKSGTHWSIMIEGLANRRGSPVELLKITTVGTSKERIEESGKRISSYAKSMDFPLLFKIIVSELKDLRKDFFEFESDEVVALFCGLHLWTQLAWPNHLRSFLKCVRSLNPCVMVVNEIEASTNASNFMDRFHGAFAFNLALFDCIEACLKDEVRYRKIVEQVFFKDMIRNIIAAEDNERFHRHEKIEFWRKLFSEFDLVEMELSESSWYQARLLIERSSGWDCCNLCMDGKCMIVGWKGTPLQSVSAWKVHIE